MWVLIKKELLHIMRDRGLIIFILYAFTIDIVLAAHGFRLIPENVSITVFDEDHSSESRELIGRLQPPSFSYPRFVENERDVDNTMKNSRSVLLLRIPEGFQKELYRGNAHLQVLVDGTQSTAAYISTAYLSEIVNRYSLDLTRREMWKRDLRITTPVEVRSRILFNPDARDDIYEGLNEFFMVITLLGMILPAALLIREKEYGTIEQIMLSPLSVRRLILVKVLGSMIFLTTVIGLSFVLVLKLYLGFPLKRGLHEFLPVAVLFQLSTTGLAFLIASVARRFSQIGMLTIVIFAPMLLLSGGWVPPEALPQWLRAATTVSPLKQFIDIGVSMLIRGAGLWDMSDRLLRLIIISSVLMITGGLLYKKRMG